MAVVEKFPYPHKVYFKSRDRDSVAAIFADSLVRSEGEITFYFGKTQVAIMNEVGLVVGTRSVPRSALDPENPFLCELDH